MPFSLSDGERQGVVSQEDVSSLRAGAATGSSQRYGRDIPGSVPGRLNKASHNLLAGGGSCLRFIKRNATCVKHTKTRYACT